MRTHHFTEETKLQLLNSSAKSNHERKQDHLFNTSSKMLSKDAWMIGCLYEVTSVVSCLMFPSVALERDKNLFVEWR